MSIANDFNNNIDKSDRGIAHYHLPGLFEFYEFYKVFLPLFYEHRVFLYDWCDMGSMVHQRIAYGGGGRAQHFGKS